MAGVVNFILRGNFNGVEIGGIYNSPIRSGFRAPTLVELHKPATVGASEQFIDPKFPDDDNIQAKPEVVGWRT